MLNDEEKKAIQYLNKYCDTDLLYEQRHYNYIKMIIRLVGKQQKEIEELKEESKEYQIGFAQGCYEKDLDWEDKIKAKIEEVEQWELYNMKIPRLSTLDERLGAKIGIKYVLQSLLEKE